MSIFSIGASTPSDDGFVIKSGRFDHVDGAGGDYLTRTNVGQGNGTWTMSQWIKLGKLSDGSWSSALFGAYHGSDATHVYIQSSNQIRWYEMGADLNTTARAFEDPSAWYHIVCQKIKQTSMKIYVNGELTDTYTNNIPGFSAMTNATAPVYIGQAPATNGTRFAAFDGLQAEVYFLDGSALGPESFGETNASTGQWVPLNPENIKPTFNWGPNGFHLPMASDKLPDKSDSYLRHTNYPTFVDYAQTPTHTVTANGGAQTSTTRKKFGTSSYSNSNDGFSALSIGWSSALGVMGIGGNVDSAESRSGDFTIEGWYYFTDLSGTTQCIGNGYGSTTYQQACYISPAPSPNIILRYFKGNNSTGTLCQGSTNLAEDTWYHLAWVRDGDFLRVYIDGVQDAELSGVNNYSFNPQGYNHQYPGTTGGPAGVRGTSGGGQGVAYNWFLGNEGTVYGASQSLKGNIDEVRVSNITRYPNGAPFVLQTEPFEDDRWTKLLLHMEGSNEGTTFTDSSGTTEVAGQDVGRHYYGEFGTVTNQKIKRQQPLMHEDGSGGSHIIGPKFGISCYGNLGYNLGGSNYQHISCETSDDYDFGTGDFTVETWVNFDDHQTNEDVFLALSSTPANFMFRLDGPNTNLAMSLMGSAYTVTHKMGVHIWYHIAVVRSSGSLSFYVDGTQIGASVSATDNVVIGSADYTIGGRTDQNRYLKGYFDEFRISNNARYTSAFTPATSAFTSDSNTVLLLHMDGQMGGTSILDSSPFVRPNLTANGNVHTDTAVKKFGTASAQFDGAGDYISQDNDYAFGRGDFTIETWINFSVVQNSGIIILTDASTSYAPYFQYHTGALAFGINGIAGLLSETWTPSADTWYHIAVSRSGSTSRMFIDGTLVDSATDNTDWISDGIQIGQWSSIHMEGYLDDIRISNSARYTASFVAPSAAFTNDNNTWLLLHCDGANDGTVFTDSATGHACKISQNAGGKAWLVKPKMGTGCYRNNGGGNGLEFPRGSSPYENSKPFEFYGTSNFNSSGEVAIDFTVECWIFLVDMTTNNQQFLMHRDSVNNGDWVFWWDATNGLTWSGDSNTLNQGNTNGWSTRTWIHIAAVRHNCIMTLYVDGVSRASNSNNKWYDGNAALAVGGVWQGGSWSNSGATEGFIDEVRICNEAKYTANFTPSTTAFKDSTDTICLLHLDGGGPGVPGSDTNIGQGQYFYNDASDAIFYDADGKPIDKAYYKWDGSNGQFVYPQSEDWQHAAGEDFTYEFWMNNWSYNGASGQRAMATGTNSPNRRGIQWRADSSGGWYMAIEDQSGASPNEAYYAKNFYPNKWKHVVMQRGSDDKVRAFVDGEEVYMTTTVSIISDSSDLYGEGLALGSVTDQSVRNYEGYITECRVSGNARYSTDFTPPVANLVSDNNTSLLLHMDGANDGTTFTDSGPDAHTVTPSGDTHTDTAIKKLGTASAQFDGTGDYLTVAHDAGFNFASGEFCVEAYVYHTGTPSDYQGIVCHRDSTGWELKMNSAQKISWYDTQSGAETLSNAAISNDTWYHVAVTRNKSGVINIWIDGVKQTAFDYTPTFTDYSHAVLIGDENQRLAATKWSGYIDEVRITKGVDRYGRFAVPTEQFVMDSNTRLIARSSWTEGGIGGDDSGNQNNFTPTGMDNPHAQIIDNPQNNWNTLNPAMALLQQTCGAVDYTSGNLTEEDIGAGGTGQNYPCAFGTIAATSGKWYAEFLALKASGESTIEGGPGVSGVDGFPTSGWNAIGLQGSNAHYVRRGELRGMGQDTSGYPTFDEFDIISVAMDVDNLKAYWAKNNVWITIGGNPGDPTSGATGTGALSMDSLVTAGAYTFEVGSDNTTDGKWACNFGQDTSFGYSGTSVAAPGTISSATDHPDANGIGQFYYPPPAEYLALCKENMPAPSIPDPTKHFNSILYTGDGSARSITGMGFQPDLLVVKKRNANYNWQDFDSVRGATGGLMESMHWNNTDQEGTDAGSVSTLDSDGFSIAGSYAGVNANTDTYVAYGWKAGGAASANTDGSITSQVSANTSAGFSIVSYTGTQANATVGHGLSQAPEFMIIKGRDDSDQWSVYHRDIGYTKLAYLNLSNAESSASSTFWQDTHPGASVFTIGSDTQLNKSANPYIAYCFHAVDDYQKIGNFIGNNNADGMFVYLGFKPALVIAKAVAEAYNWTLFDAKRPGYNVTNIQQQPNDNGSETNIGANRLKVDLLANGFKCRSSYSELNSSTQYMYYAVAESPFKTNNAQ